MAKTKLNTRPMRVPYPFLDNKSGRVVYVRFEFGEAPAIGDQIVRRGRSLTRLACSDVADESAMLTPSSIRKRRSSALGVPTFQIPEAQRHYEKTFGYRAQFDPRNGDMLFSSRGERNKVLAMTGRFDQDAGYGDRAPQN